LALIGGVNVLRCATTGSRFCGDAVLHRGIPSTVKARWPVRRHVSAGVRTATGAGRSPSLATGTGPSSSLGGSEAERVGTGSSSSLGGSEAERTCEGALTHRSFEADDGREGRSFSLGLSLGFSQPRSCEGGRRPPSGITMGIRRAAAATGAASERGSSEHVHVPRLVLPVCPEWGLRTQTPPGCSCVITGQQPF